MVNILQEYSFCGVLGSFHRHGFSRSVTEIIGDSERNGDEKDKKDEKKRTPKHRCSICQICGGCRGHVVLGLLLGMFAFYLFSFWAPQGDSYAWVYYIVDTEAFVQVRCQETNATASPSPWCYAPK